MPSEILRAEALPSASVLEFHGWATRTKAKALFSGNGVFGELAADLQQHYA